MSEFDSIATTFVLQAIQEWGQSDEERIAAIDGVIEAADFDADAVAFPVFGGIWTKTPIAVGEDGAIAGLWLQEMLEGMPRGKFEDERDHVAQAIEARRASIRA